MLESISDEREAISEAGDAEDDQSAVGDSAAISEAGESRDDQSAVGHCEAVGNCEATSDAGDHEATSDLGDGAAKSEAGPGSSAGDCEEAEDEDQVSDQPAIGGEEDASEAASGDHHEGGVHLRPRSPSTSRSTSDWRRRGPRGPHASSSSHVPSPPRRRHRYDGSQRHRHRHQHSTKVSQACKICQPLAACGSATITR